MKNQKEREVMLNKFADPEASNTQEFIITRPQNDGKSFSQEALDDYRESGEALCRLAQEWPGYYIWPMA